MTTVPEEPAAVSRRFWKNDGPDSADVHVMGNGRMLVYAVGPDLIDLLGPPYSSPRIFSLETRFDGSLTDEIRRRPGTAIWDHVVRRGGSLMMEFAECVDPANPVYLRRISCRRPGISFLLRPADGEPLRPDAALRGTWIRILPPGGTIFRYPTNLTGVHRIVPFGACRLEPAGEGALWIRCAPGTGGFAIVGAVDDRAGAVLAEECIKTGPDPRIREAERFWKGFTGRRRTRTAPVESLDGEEERILDGVAVLLKVQQSAEGAETAGHFYPLAYVRDQYGVARGMLALGMLEEARAALEFRRRKFERFGDLHNAESMGTDCARHMHENDEVELPAYVVLQAADYLDRTGDDGFLETIGPMLQWCRRVQRKHLAGGLLPFNGDETYVAGGFFPRSGLLQGSAESTLLFLESERRVLRSPALRRAIGVGDPAGALEEIAGLRMTWRRHFFRRDRILVNAPAREDHIVPPRFRHGVCEGACGAFGWTERTAHGRYLCPDCIGRKDPPPERPDPMEIHSVSLLPPFLESDLLSPPETRAVVERILSRADPGGHVPTVPGGAGCVGYDPGFLLYALARLNHPAAPAAWHRLLRMLDETGAWAEYYDADDRPRRGSCRARPWESAVNSVALLKSRQAGPRGPA